MKFDESAAAESDEDMAPSSIGMKFYLMGLFHSTCPHETASSKRKKRFCGGAAAHRPAAGAVASV